MTAVGMELRTSESEADNMADRRRPRQSNARCPQSQKDPPGLACATILLKVDRQCLPNVGQERHVLDHLAFAMDNDFP